MSKERQDWENDIEYDERIRREKDEELCKMYYSTFHSVEGQVVLNDLLNSFYRRTSLTDDADSNKVLINEGKRFVVLHILSHIEFLSKQPEH